MFLSEQGKSGARHQNDVRYGAPRHLQSVVDCGPSLGGVIGDGDVPQPPSMVGTIEGLQRCIRRADWCICVTQGLSLAYLPPTRVSGQEMTWFFLGPVMSFT